MRMSHQQLTVSAAPHAGEPPITAYLHSPHRSEASQHSRKSHYAKGMCALPGSALCRVYSRVRCAAPWGHLGLSHFELDFRTLLRIRFQFSSYQDVRYSRLHVSAAR